MAALQGGYFLKDIRCDFDTGSTGFPTARGMNGGGFETDCGPCSWE
jgi:hypothetical protein